MCGIAGAFGVEAAAIEAMVAAMHHRGPDDRGVFRSSSAMLGMSRLAIIDTSSAGHQPMVWGGDEVVMVFNGEIYNHHRLRRELEAKGHCFVSTSDTEVVLNLYIEHGEEFVTRLRGMFVIAVLDRRRGPGQERLFLVRDHLGIKPLLYSRVGDGLVFASEMKALIASGVVMPRLDENAVRQLLMRGAVCQPSTILAGVEMLMPGHLMDVSKRGISIARYWQPGAGRRPDAARSTYVDQVALVKSELERIVSEQMVADVPVGAFLSGGLDSSLLVGLMSEIKSDPIRTFSVGFGEESSDLDECEDSLIVARHLGTDHSRIEIDQEQIYEGLGAFVHALDQPSVDGLNAWVVSGVAGKHVKVAISGTGGDELFAGYPWFRAMQAYNASSPPAWADLAARAAAQFGGAIGIGAKIAAKLPEGFVAHFAAQYRHFDAGSAALLLGRKTSELALADIADLVRVDRLRGGGALDRTSLLCLASYTQNQLLRDVDATSMAHSLEVRIPFLDPDLADLALSLPEDARVGPQVGDAQAGSYRALGTKRVLLDVAAGILPHDLTTRQKRGFSMPLDRWLRGRLRPVLEDTIHHPQADVSEIVDTTQAVRVLNSFLEGSLHWGRPWLLMVLNLWYLDLLDCCKRGVQSRGAVSGIARVPTTS